MVACGDVWRWCRRVMSFRARCCCDGRPLLLARLSGRGPSFHGVIFGEESVRSSPWEGWPALMTRLTALTAETLVITVDDTAIG